MNLKDSLLEAHSLSNTTKIRDWVLESKKNLKKLMVLFLSPDKKCAQRASWVVSKVYDIKPEWLYVYERELIAALEKPIHGSIRRNSLRMLQTMSIQEENQGKLVEIVFERLMDAKEELAVKAFAMTVAYNLVLPYPELQSELKIIIQDQLPFATPSFKSRANKILSKI
ncbi:hypothetical protein [uncultured Cytophaga sp.]|uniref:hypothetical protein n=1 Tax=uncultured Cytophaga sp. TaxID=160238 RepID=UPI0026029B9D|nr:hypothetical protein [uncultured Cytophaga sp.]